MSCGATSGLSPAVSKARAIKLVVPVLASFSTSDHEPLGCCSPLRYRTPSRIARSTCSPNAERRRSGAVTIRFAFSVSAITDEV